MHEVNLSLELWHIEAALSGPSLSLIVAHTGSKTQSWLEDNVYDFLTKEEWPPTSPDLGGNSISFYSEF